MQPQLNCDWDMIIIMIIKVFMKRRILSELEKILSARTHTDTGTDTDTQTRTHRHTDTH